MQKVRTIEWLAGVLVMVACTGLAQGAQESAVTVSDLIQRAKDERQREALGRKSEPDKPGVDATIAIEPPQLVALYGVGTDMKAEISYDGRIQVIRESGALSGMGEWRHVELLPHGVRLTTAAWQADPPATLPVRAISPRRAASSASQGSPSTSVKRPADVAQDSPAASERRCVPQAGCLLLSVTRPQPPGSGTSEGAVAAGTGVDPMAALLARQPTPVGGSVPFLGKPAAQPASR